jgi:hypothetical protein
LQKGTLIEGIDMRTKSGASADLPQSAQRLLAVYLTITSPSNAFLERLVYGDLSDKAFQIALHFETLPNPEKRALLEVLQMRTEEST